MTADYAGAKLAIKNKFKAEWVDGGNPFTPVDYPNEAAPETTDSGGNPIPNAAFEILNAGTQKMGLGTPGKNVVVYDGLIKVRIFTPNGNADYDGTAYALRANSIFRNQQFYDDVTPGSYVRSGYDINGQPRVDDGDAESEDGKWNITTAVCPFEFWTRE